MEDWIPRHRITVDEYHRMVDVGVLAEDANVELIEGEIIDVAPIGSPHAALTTVLTHCLSAVVGDRGLVRVQLPLLLGRASEPQPDVALVRPRADYYRDRHPGAQDALLVVEISFSTLRYDRYVKLPLYARHAIPEVWIIDPTPQLHVFRVPRDQEYQDCTVLAEPRRLSLAAVPEVSVDVSALLRL